MEKNQASWRRVGYGRRRADVLSFTPEGKDEKIFATGLRNCSGLTVQLATGELWCAVNERDEIGDDVPFEYATQIKEGAFYGWPWFYIDGNEDPITRVRGQTLRTRSQFQMFSLRRIPRPCRSPFMTATAFPLNIRVMPSSRCTAHEIEDSVAETRWSAFALRTASPLVNMRTS